MPDDSTRTVLIAIGTDLGVALAKVGTAVFTGSSAVAAGAAEALADTANERVPSYCSASQQPPA